MSSQKENPVIYHIRIMLRKATPEQLSIIYIFVKGYLRNQLTDEEKEVTLESSD